jgi:hypothetical protein
MIHVEVPEAGVCARHTVTPETQRVQTSAFLSTESSSCQGAISSGLNVLFRVREVGNDADSASCHAFGHEQPIRPHLAVFVAHQFVPAQPLVRGVGVVSLAPHIDTLPAQALTALLH